MGSRRSRAEEGNVEEASEQDAPKFACTVGTQNAIINGIRHDHGAEVEGGMTAQDIHQHRRQGVSIVCPDLDGVDPAPTAA